MPPPVFLSLSLALVFGNKKVRDLLSPRKTDAPKSRDIRATPEAQEGLTAFLEKRKAAWITPTPQKKQTKKR